VFRLQGQSNWVNLVEWIKERHFFRSLTPDLDVPKCQDDYIVGDAFRLADVMRCRPWTDVQMALEAYLHGLKGTCSEWADGTSLDSFCH
jgi:hypothetical protein